MSKAKARKAVAYVVERAAGFGTAGPDLPPFDPEDPDQDPEDYLDQQSYVPVAAFADRAAAEARARELEAEVRAAFPPTAFAAGEFGDPKAVAAGIKALGLSPPTFGRDEFRHPAQFQEWWAAHSAELTPERRAGVWKLFDHVRVYRVSEIDLKG